MLVDSSEFLKYGHLNLQLFAHVLKKYRLLMGEELHSFNSFEIAETIKKS